MTERALTPMPLSLLVPDKANPKAHSLDTIGDSIGRFGYVEPVVLDERTGFIVSGHGRTEALRARFARGEAPPEGVLIGEKGEWLVPVITGWASKNDAEARGALIALNRTGEIGGWQDEVLLDLLEDLSRQDEGFTGIGYDQGELDRLRAYLNTSDFVGTYDGDDQIKTVTIREGQAEVRVVYEATAKQDIYTALSELPFVIDVRDALS
jgi:hypothetical protein